MTKSIKKSPKKKSASNNKRGILGKRLMLVAVAVVVLFSGIYLLAKDSLGDTRYSWTTIEARSVNIKICTYRTDNNTKKFRLRIVPLKKAAYVEPKVFSSRAAAYTYRKILPAQYNQTLEFNDNSVGRPITYKFYIKDNDAGQEKSIRKSDVVNCNTPANAPPVGGASGWWYRLRMCESSGNYRAINPAGPYYGAYQFSQATWNDLGSPYNSSQYQGRIHLASPAVQDAAARLLYSRRGWAPWPYCADDFPPI